MEGDSAVCRGRLQVAAPSELAELIARYVGSDGVFPTPLSRLSLLRLSRPTEPIPVLLQPALVIVAQGRP